MKIDWRMAKAAAPISNLVFDGLRNLGKDRVTPDVLEGLRRKLRLPDRRRLLKDLPLAPYWMQPLLRQIAGKGGKRRPVAAERETG